MQVHRGRDDHVPDSRKIECKAVHVGHVLLLEDRDGPASEVITQQLDSEELAGRVRLGDFQVNAPAPWILIPTKREVRRLCIVDPGQLFAETADYALWIPASSAAVR